MYQSSQSVTEDSQSRGRGRIIYTDYTALTISNRHEKKANLPSLQWWCSCVSCCCCAGGSSVRFSSNYACLLSQFALLCTRSPPRSVSVVLFGQRCRDCFRHTLLLIPFTEIDSLRTTVHRSSCNRKQQAAVASVISTASREASSCFSTNLYSSK